MANYNGHYAELYDEIYADKQYDGEVEYIVKLIRRHVFSKKISVLELASGTGTHALLFEKKGFSVTASDYSDSMLSVAQKKIKKSDAHITLRKIDMIKIPKFPKLFDAVLCLFDSIGYVRTNDAIEKVLKGVRTSLVKKGLFIFEFWHEPAMVKHFEPVRTRDLHLHNGTIAHRVSKTVLDFERSIAEVSYTLDEYKGKKQMCHLEEVQENRFFSIPEMQYLLGKNGFRSLKFFSGYSDKEKITDRSFHIVCLAQKK